MSEHDCPAALGWSRASTVMGQREENGDIQILAFFFALGAFVFLRYFFFVPALFFGPCACEHKSAEARKKRERSPVLISLVL
jgi:hypothetical protein